MTATGTDLRDRSKYAASPARWWPAGLGLLAGGAIVWLANGRGEASALADWWVNWVDPGITVATLVAAGALSILSALRAWDESLEKRLDVHCFYNGRYVASCWEASLAHEGDIRQWGQQIGSQMFGGDKLQFTVTPVFHPPRTRRDGTGVRRVYVIEIELTQDPEPHGGYLVWDPRNNNRRLYLAERPDQPLHPSAPELEHDPPMSRPE